MIDMMMMRRRRLSTKVINAAKLKMRIIRNDSDENDLIFYGGHQVDDYNCHKFFNEDDAQCAASVPALGLSIGHYCSSSSWDEGKN